MTLAKKTVWNLGLLTLGMLVAAASVAWTLVDLSHLARATHEEFEELRDLRQAESNLSEIQALLKVQDYRKAAAQIRQTATPLHAFEQLHAAKASIHSETHEQKELRTVGQIQKRIEGVRELLDAIPAKGTLSEGAKNHALDQIGIALMDAHFLAGASEGTVEQIHVQAGRSFENTFKTLIGVFITIILVASVINVLHYRSVIGPLRSVRDAASRMAGGDLNVRLQPVGDQEFVELQQDFNHMAEDLQSLYADLERRVAEQSQRLAVSERLASVGFLAAGVAHEINNPLGIMSGYAESALRRLRRPARDANLDEQLIKDLEIVREEAFRCKKITHQLLDLSRMGDQHRTALSLWDVIEDVETLLHASDLGKGRNLLTTGDRTDRMMVNGSKPELKQVLLNLTANALQAVTPAVGRVEIRAVRSNGWAQIEVRDNGYGMTQETLRHVFEPFFTMKKGQAGLGLGLAISHAIVERHHGVLLAQSEGSNCGSVFTVRLPALSERSI